jgi:hypothetical protein
VDFQPQNADLNCVGITVGGNLIVYPGELTTRTSDWTTSTILWNNVVSTEGATFAGLGIKNVYLGTPLDTYKYRQMDLTLFPPHIVKQSNLNINAKGGFVYLAIYKTITDFLRQAF